MAKVKLTQAQYNKIMKSRRGKNAAPKGVQQYSAPIGPRESTGRKLNRAVERGASGIASGIGALNRSLVEPRPKQSGKGGKGKEREPSPHYGIEPRTSYAPSRAFIGSGFNYGQTQAHGTALHNMGAEWLGLNSFAGFGNFLDYGSELLPAAKRRR